MNRFRIASLTFVALLSACGGGNSPASCAEFASSVAAMIERNASGDELARFIDDTEEQVARLIAQDPERAGPCVEAALEALFATGIAELEDMLEQ